jgi:hypothetical protein
MTRIECYPSVVEVEEKRDEIRKEERRKGFYLLTKGICMLYFQFPSIYLISYDLTFGYVYHSIK